MTIDPTIPLMSKGINGLKMLEDGSQLAQLWQSQKTDGELNRIYKESEGNLTKMLGLGKQSKLSRFVVPQIQSQIAAQNKLYTDQLKSEADIAKTSSEAFKNNQQGQGYGVDNAQKKLGAINQAITSGAMTGDKSQILLGLDGLRRVGMLSDADYSSYFDKLGTMNSPDEIKQWATGLALAGSKDPASYLMQTANNVADNQTSTNNNIRSTNASIYSTDVGAQTADKNRSQQESQFQQNYTLNQQKQFFEQNKPIGFETGNDGYRYAIYPNGKGVRVLGEDGQPIKMQSKQDGSIASKIAEIQGVNDQANQTIKNLQRAKDLSNQGIYDGSFSNLRADLMGNFGGTQESMRTQQYNNIVMQNALASLKAIFGGNPTEGERDILLKIQASSNYPTPVREQILDDAIAAAQAKIQSNNGQIQTIRGGSTVQQSSQTPSVNSYSFMP